MTNRAKPGRVEAVVRRGNGECILCRKTTETERSGKLHVSPDGTAVHVACAKLYVVLRCLREIQG